MELSIVMLMAGLISSLAYGGYSLFVKQFYAYEKNTATAMDTRQFLYLLKKDIGQCQVLYASGTQLECEYPAQTVVYNFENNQLVLRTQVSRTDTFKLEQKDPIFSFRGQTAGVQKTVIDEIRFTSVFKKTETTTQFKKQYSNKTLMELNQLYGH